MNSQMHHSDHSLIVAQDSAGQIIRPAVQIPQKIEIKVKRPKINLLPVRSDSSLIQHNSTASTKGKNVLAKTIGTTNMEITSIKDSLPDTLDYVLISDWKLSRFKSQLWSSDSNDSLCILSIDQPRKKGITKPGSSLNNKETTSQIKTNQYTEQQNATSLDYHSELRANPWFIGTLLLFVAITGIIRLKWHKYLTQVFNAILFSNLAIKLQSTSGNSEKSASFLMNLLFYGNFSLFLYEFMLLTHRNFLELDGWKLWLAILGFLLIVFNLKIIVYGFIGWVFKIQERTRDYQFRSAVMNKAFGIILMPLVVLFPFLEPNAQPIVPKIGFLIFILLYLIQITRGIVANLMDTLSGYYIILYLCALEILPLSILYKVLFN